MKTKKEPVMISLLKGKRKEIADDLIKDYKFVFFCTKKGCRNMYGSDKSIDNGLCPLCESREANKNTKKKHKRNTLVHKTMVLN